jgi:hypothetical protein
MALSAGAVNQDVERLPRNRKTIPTFPFNRDFEWKPVAHSSQRAVGEPC